MSASVCMCSDNVRVSGCVGREGDREGDREVCEKEDGSVCR